MVAAAIGVTAVVAVEEDDTEALKFFEGYVSYPNPLCFVLATQYAERYYVDCSNALLPRMNFTVIWARSSLLEVLS